ncbi:hypothetical protein HDIA_3553 [Hartmannibacter diazotrophicus]|uniref:Uncharacterized protein n=1 Tax=Hartmannibacter diazotrophicus TaxID=1482074 RepID=A0A2C9D9T8_9HYPH|nr:hypothetical protein [Hartmannibacter diazotrophicus]SON57094.1 hypothetical protein HDIA_3553 [Hartmannibacter diazotrophicus]
MIEQAMYFALGVLTTGIVTLLVAPALAHRARRLAIRDALARLPMTLEEIAAQKDAIRAEYAAKTSALERRTSEAEDALAIARLRIHELENDNLALQASSNDFDIQIEEEQEREGHLRQILAEREAALLSERAHSAELQGRIAQLLGRLPPEPGAEKRSVQAAAADEPSRSPLPRAAEMAARIAVPPPPASQPPLPEPSGTKTAGEPASPNPATAQPGSSPTDLPLRITELIGEDIPTETVVQIVRTGDKRITALGRKLRERRDLQGKPRDDDE